MGRQKTYFYASEFIDKNTGRKSLVFCGQDGRRCHWAGGGPTQVNFVLAKLVEKRGTKRGIQIYQAFNDALLEISKEKPSNRNFPKGVLVMFSKEKDDNIVSKMNGGTVDEDIHKRESRLQETGESKKETSSSTKI